MLESVVSTLLNRVLGSYVSNLNYNQLKIGIWSGKQKQVKAWIERVFNILFAKQGKSNYAI